MNKQHNHYTRHSIRKQKDDDDDEEDYGEMPPLLYPRCPVTGEIIPDPKEFDLEDILQEIEKDDPNVVRSALEKSQMASNGMTASHFQKCGRLETSFIEGLKSIVNEDGSQTYANLLIPVETVVGRDKRTVPVVFLMCAGVQSNAKLLLVNKVVVEWQIRLKKKRIGTDGCPWYNPSSQSAELRAFFGFMRKTYGWKYTDADLKGFDGSLHAVMSEAFQQRAKEWEHTGYGVRNENCELKEEDYEKIDLTKFDESDLYQLQSKTMIVLGLAFGLRGNAEHLNLTVGNLTSGFFPQSHPDFPGVEWWGLQNLTDKTFKLTLNNTTKRTQKELGRYPVLSDGKNGPVALDFGGTMKRLYEKIVSSDKPRQEENEKITNRLYRRVSADGTYFENSPLGKDKIKERIQDGFRLFGIKTWMTLRPHALRGVFISILANDDGVNLKETMAAARHTSVSASSGYQARNLKSESAKISAIFNAIGQPNKSSVSESLPIKNKGSDLEVTNVPSELVLSDEDDTGSLSLVSTTANSSAGTSTVPAFTQIQMDFLQREIEEVQSGRDRHARSPPRHMFDYDFDLRVRDRATKRRRISSSRRYSSYHRSPEHVLSSSYHTGRATGRERSYSLAAEDPHACPRYMPRRSVPSRREMEIHYMRRRLADMREERMHDFPYASDRTEAESLYRDAMDEYHLEDRTMSSARRRI